ncbi:MAG TPA: RDD family protein [Nitriliruptorales bacterium]
MSEPQPPPEPGAAAGQVTIGLGKRFGARLLDGLIVGIPMWIVLAVLPGVSPGGFVGGVLTGIAYLAYFVYLEGTSGQTLGKGLLHIKVTTGGAPLSFDTAFKRNWWAGLSIFSGIPILGALVGLVSLAIVIYIAITISGDERNQGWHDKQAGTLVVGAA